MSHKSSLREAKRQTFQERKRENELNEKGEERQEKGIYFEKGERECIPREIQH
jgi:hypothetical protein